MRFTSTIVPLLLALPAFTAPALDASCQKIYELCINTVRNVPEAQFLAAPWGISKECTLAATCFPSSPDELLSALYGRAFNKWTDGPKSVNVARLPKALYDSLASSGQTVNQQSYIDAYYGLLSTVGGPYPSNIQPISQWTKIAQWAGFCSNGKAVPYQNLADWFQYANTVSVAPGPCDGTSS